MSLSRQEAADTVAAVQAAFDAGAPAPGGPSGRGRPSAIAVAARHLGLNPQSVRDRIAAGGPCANHGLFVDWTTDDDKVVEMPRAMSTYVDKNDRKRAAARGELGFEPVLPGYEIDKTTSVMDEVGNIEKTYVTQKRERGESFVMPPAHAIKGVSALIDGNGRTIQQWIKTREDADRDQLFIDAIKTVFDGYKGAAEFVPGPEVTSDTLTVYPVADLHVGMYSWAAETGDDYDLAIVERVFMEKMSQLVEKATPSKTAIVLNLGDYFHSDSRANRTEQSGAALDVDSRYARVLQIGVRLMIQCIELALQKHEHVIVRGLPGNHDYHASLALTTALGAFFHNSPRVTVDHDPSKFFVYRFGETLIVATHGDMAKPAQMPGLVAARWPKLWGETKFRYCYTGHIHHKSVVAGELNGMICESFQTLAAKDFWHASMGYVAGRSLVAITHDKEHGECDRVTASIPPVCGPAEMRRAA